MFNLARFNLQRFNLPSRNETDLSLAGKLDESFGAVIGTSENAYVAEALSEQYRQTTYLDPGEHATGSMAETFASNIAIVADVPSSTALTESIVGKVYIGKDSYNALCFEDNFINATYISIDKYNIFMISGIFLGETSLGADHYTQHTLYEIFDGQIATTQFNIYTANFNIGIPPGSTLVMDSDNFVALLDGENVIHLHNGDWFWLCRDTYDVQIQMGQEAPISITMIYQERYL